MLNSGMFKKGQVAWNKNKDCKQYNWGRKKIREAAYCVDCKEKGILTEIEYGCKRCLLCYKKSRKHYISLNYCIDCDKLLKSFKSKRCRICDNIFRWSNGYYKKKVSKNIGLANKGKIRSTETRSKISFKTGGTGIPYELTEYGTEFDSALKEQVRFRGGYKCQECGCPQIENGRQLDCHHIDYNKKNNVLNNLVALCHKCHTKTNFNREYWIKYLLLEEKIKC